MNNSSHATLVQSKVLIYVINPASPSQRKSNRIQNSYSQNLSHEFLMKIIRKEENFGFCQMFMKNIVDSCPLQHCVCKKQWAVFDLVFCSFFHAVMHRFPTTSSEEVKNSKTNASSKYSKLYNSRVDICFFFFNKNKMSLVT